ncbi:hypothetical protein GCM10010236_70690 [Streptomyces eurythermus]|nr:hypothetical protein GCM10010236_70690 [Streptomyces eurythermus]
MRVEELEAELERLRSDLVDAEEEQPAETVVGPRKPVGPRRAVPHRQNAAGVEDLSVDYQAVMAAEAGGDGLGARRVAVVLGWDSASASRVEGARVAPLMWLAK